MQYVEPHAQLRNRETLYGKCLQIPQFTVEKLNIYNRENTRIEGGDRWYFLKMC